MPIVEPGGFQLPRLPGALPLPRPPSRRTSTKWLVYGLFFTLMPVGMIAAFLSRRGAPAVAHAAQWVMIVFNTGLVLALIGVFAWLFFAFRRRSGRIDGYLASRLAEDARSRAVRRDLPAADGAE